MNFTSKYSSTPSIDNLQEPGRTKLGIVCMNLNTEKMSTRRASGDCLSKIGSATFGIRIT